MGMVEGVGGCRNPIVVGLTLHGPRDHAYTRERPNIAGARPIEAGETGEMDRCALALWLHALRSIRTNLPFRRFAP
jgi:hypothetical protein